jgi:hypothetical protein
MLPSESCFWWLWRAGSGSRGAFGLDKGMSLGVRIRWHSGKETIFRPELASVGPKMVSFPDCHRILTTSDMPLAIPNRPLLPNPGRPLDRQRLSGRSFFAAEAFAKAFPLPLTSHPACFLRLDLAASQVASS